MATHNNEELAYLEQVFPANQATELEKVRVSSNWLERFPVQLPFQLQVEQSKEMEEEQQVVQRTATKLRSVLALLVGRMRSQQLMFDVLGRIHDFLQRHTSESEEHQMRYKELLGRLVKIKSMKKELNREELGGLVVKELMELLLCNVPEEFAPKTL